MYDYIIIALFFILYLYYLYLFWWSDDQEDDMVFVAFTKSPGAVHNDVMSLTINWPNRSLIKSYC